MFLVLISLTFKMCRLAIFILLIGTVITAHVSEDGEHRKGKSGQVDLVRWYGSSQFMMQHYVKVGHDYLRQKKKSPKAMARFFRDEMVKKFPGMWVCSVFENEDEAIFDSWGMAGLGAYVGHVGYVICGNCRNCGNFVEPPTTTMPPTTTRQSL